MLKKWCMRLVRGIICLVLITVIADIGLHILLRTQWFKARVMQTVQQALGRDIKLAGIGANLRGIVIEGFAAAEQGGFENGTFLEAGQLRIELSLLHLLHGHAKANLVLLSDVTIRAAVAPDGQSSWQDLLSPSETVTPEETTNDSFPLHVTATHVRLDNAHFIYTDHTGPHTLDIAQLNIGVEQFSLRDPFSFYVQASIQPTFQGKTVTLPFVLRGSAALNELDLTQASVEIYSLNLALQKSFLQLKGRVENLVNPNVTLQGELRHFSSQGLAGLVEVPPFKLEKAEFSLKAVADLEKSAFTLHFFTLQAPGVQVQTKGGLLYGNPQALEYEFTGEGNVKFAEAGRWFTALAEPYRLVGNVQAQVQATQKQVSGEIILDEFGGIFPSAGNVSKVNSRINFLEGMDFKTGNASVELTGKLNGRPATASLHVQQRTEAIDVKAKLQAEEIVLPGAKQPQTEEQEPAAETSAARTAAWPWPPVQVQAELEVGKLDVPYFYGTNVVFKADMQGLAPGFKQAHGSLKLSTGEGKIQDLYKLTQANPLTKVLFLSLNITGKVFNSLDVFGVLGSIGEGIASVVTGGDKSQEEQTVHTQTILGPDGETIEVPVVETNKKVEGELAYDKFVTEIDFMRGLATVKQGSFVSSMMSFRLDGTTDFNTQAVNLTVHAAPGKHEVDGMMPLTLKIGGTVEDPQGSMQLLGSVTSLVTQSVTNNVVSRQVGKGIKGVWGLFKKKEGNSASSLPEESSSVTSHSAGDGASISGPEEPASSEEKESLGALSSQPSR